MRKPFANYPVYQAMYDGLMEEFHLEYQKGAEERKRVGKQAYRARKNAETERNASRLSNGLPAIKLPLGKPKRIGYTQTPEFKTAHRAAYDKVFAELRKELATEKVKRGRKPAMKRNLKNTEQVIKTRAYRATPEGRAESKADREKQKAELNRLEKALCSAEKRTKT